MKLKTVKTVTWILAGLVIALILICYITKLPVWGFASIALVFVIIAFEIIFYRCPRCGKFLGRTDAKFCPHCGSDPKE